MLFTIAILLSFIPETFNNFFGDWRCQGTGIFDKNMGRYVGCTYGPGHAHDSELHWGYRHWLFATMSATLGIIQFYGIIDSVDEENKK